jgi:hypothetical protein
VVEGLLLIVSNFKLKISSWVSELFGICNMEFEINESEPGSLEFIGR